MHIAVISSRRPQNVERYAQLNKRAVWYVGEGEGADYAAAGAKHIRESGGLCQSRNAALEEAFAAGRSCLQLSDDLKAVYRATAKGKKEAVELLAAVDLLAGAMADSGAKLGGCAPTANAFYFNPNRPTHTAAFIVGDFILVEPSTPRFDTAMTLKEDYDFTLQHLAQYSIICRANFLLPEFEHRSNRGGAVAVRTSAEEQKNIRHLRSKWGSIIRDNPRRKDEILLKLR